MSHSSLSTNSSRKTAKIDARSIGYCYALERRFADPVLAGLDAFSAASRSVACFSEDAGLSVEDYHSVVESLRTTWSTRSFKPTERPCFVLAVRPQKKAEVLLLATFGGKTAGELDQLTRRFVASIDPTRPQPHDDSITGKTQPAWKRNPQHIVLIRTLVDHSDLVRNYGYCGTKLVNHIELGSEARRREEEALARPKEVRDREWHSHRNRMKRLRRLRLQQTTSGSMLGMISEGAVAAQNWEGYLDSLNPGLNSTPASMLVFDTSRTHSKLYLEPGDSPSTSSQMGDVSATTSASSQSAAPPTSVPLPATLSSNPPDEKIPNKKKSRTQWANIRHKRSKKIKRELHLEGEGEEPVASDSESERREGILVSAARRLGLGKQKS